MRSLCVAAAVAGLAVGSVAARGTGDEAAGETDCAGWGPDSAYGRMFDPSTIATVPGQVAAIDLVNPRKGMACGVCLQLRTGEGTLRVHLGPERFVAGLIGRLAPRDAVEVTGSRVLFKGEPTLIATSLRMGGRVVVLRSQRGVPVWDPDSQGPTEAGE